MTLSGISLVGMVGVLVLPLGQLHTLIIVLSSRGVILEPCHAIYVMMRNSSTLYGSVDVFDHISHGATDQ